MPTFWTICIIATLHEFMSASVSVCMPWPLVFAQLIGSFQSPTISEPPQ